MGKYKNPMPSIEDELVSRKYTVGFTFVENATLDEAVEGINNLIAEHGGKIPRSWIKMGEPRGIRYHKPQN